MSEYTPVRAPRGTTISCKGWHQEAALRMLMNNLDEEVAENPRKLIVYGGSGRAARSWEQFHAIVEALRRLENDETLLVQSGKPVGIFRTFRHSPRVLIANANLVPHWATRDEFNRLEALQLTMYGQMLDLHRHTRNRSRNLRNIRRCCAHQFWRFARRKDPRDRRHGRYGRRSTPGGNHEWRCVPRRRSGSGTFAAAYRHRVSRHDDPQSRRGMDARHLGT